ncbi:MAG: Lrp/AsnC family transcriptional regulator [Actinobacteria bacterium]|nr:MAG: Lrp/AsnC family transcriptional regulator [Actinomycetota bacterium]
MADVPDLDRTDRAIIALLQENARLSNKELAAGAGIAPSTCSERMRRLETIGVFSGFHAAVDPRVLGIGLQAMIAVRLRRHSAEEVEAFELHAAALPEVISLSHVTGPNDFLIRVVVRDADHLRQLAVSGFTTMREVDHIETALIFEHNEKGILPDLSE